jgi:hypothetical protein
VTSVTGSGSLPGTQGSTATVKVSVQRFLWWTFGTLTVNDSAAGLKNLQAPILFGSVPRPANGSVTLTGNWFGLKNNAFVNYTIRVTVTDGLTAG